MKEKVLHEFREWLKTQPALTINYEHIGAVYVRVSTDRQEELSPISQLKKAWEWSQSRHILLDENSIFIEEEGVSGRKAEKREAFKEMISIAKSDKKKFDTIIVWKFSRFARNQEESIVYKSMLKKNGVDVVSISEPLIEGPFGSLIERIIEWMDEYYSINLSGEVTRGMTEKAHRGEPQTAPAFGYDISDNMYIPNEIEAPIVQFIYEKYASGAMEMINIAKYLNEHQIVTKKGKKFENRTIWYILTNPVYIGKIRWTPNGKLTREEIYDNSKSIIEDGKHQPLVTEETFNKVHERLSKQRIFSVKRQRITSEPHHWLKGLIRCGDCGKTFVRSGKKFRCNGYNKGACSCSISLNIDEVENLVLNQLKSDSQSFIKINIIKAKRKETKEDSELKMLEKQLELATQKQERIKQAFENGIDTLEEYKENKKRINGEISNLKAKIELCKKNSIQDDKEETLIQENMSTVYNVLTNPNIEIKKKYDVAHFLINKIVYNEETNNLTLYYNEFRDNLPI